MTQAAYILSRLRAHDAEPTVRDGRLHLERTDELPTELWAAAKMRAREIVALLQAEAEKGATTR